jgi:hypothetical protein
MKRLTAAKIELKTFKDTIIYKKLKMTAKDTFFFKKTLMISNASHNFKVPHTIFISLEMSGSRMSSLKNRGKSLALPDKSSSVNTFRSAGRTSNIDDEKIWKFDVAKIHLIEGNRSGQYHCFKLSRKTKEGALYSTSATLTSVQQMP